MEMCGVSIYIQVRTGFLQTSWSQLGWPNIKQDTLVMPTGTSYVFNVISLYSERQNKGQLGTDADHCSHGMSHRHGLRYPRSRAWTQPKPSDFLGKKTHSMPSFGGEVKPSVPCHRFAACKKTLAIYVEVRIAGKFDRPFLTQFHPSLTEVSHVAWRGAPWRWRAELKEVHKGPAA
jgi:hypothetical protein